MQGNGNDFIVIEDLENKIKDDAALAVQLCNRNFAIGADGILIVRKSTIADIQMVIINSDGSYAAMCGNGIRCFAKYVWEKGLVHGEEISIETGDGVKTAHLNISVGKVSSVKINMGNPNFLPEKIPAIWESEIVDLETDINNKKYKITSLLMGVPHTVVFGELEKIDVEEGKYIEKDKLFPEGSNVNFCQVVDKNNIKVKTWERGAGPTLACGTGSCASVIAANRLGLVGEKVDVEIPGGKLTVELSKDGVFMTGPAEVSFWGEYNF
jgi:diaminopimelate epimerase